MRPGLAEGRGSAVGRCAPGAVRKRRRRPWLCAASRSSSSSSLLWPSRSHLGPSQEIGCRRSALSPPLGGGWVFILFYFIFSSFDRSRSRRSTTSLGRSSPVYSFGRHCRSPHPTPAPIPPTSKFPHAWGSWSLSGTSGLRDGGGGGDPHRWSVSGIPFHKEDPPPHPTPPLISTSLSKGRERCKGPWVWESHTPRGPGLDRSRQRFC